MLRRCFRPGHPADDQLQDIHPLGSSIRLRHAGSGCADGRHHGGLVHKKVGSIKGDRPRSRQAVSFIPLLVDEDCYPRCDIVCGHELVVGIVLLKKL